MTVRYNETKKVWEALASKRHAVTGRPMNLRRSGFKTKAKADCAEQEMIEKLNARSIQSETPRWNVVVERCLAWKREMGFEPHTLHCYRVGLNAHTSQWNERGIDEISRNDIVSVVKDGMAKNKPSHQKNVLKYIRAVFNYAIDEKIIAANPMPRLRIKTPEKLQEVLTSQEAARFLNAAKHWDYDWYAIWAVALYTGMRSGELYALRWENVEIDRRLIYVKLNWTSKSGFKTPKSGSGRVVEIAEALIPLLKELKLKYQNTGFVLARLQEWEKGEQAQVTRNFLASIGIKPIRFHALRATWATLLLSSGVPALRVQKVAGWERTETMDRYIRMAGVDIKGMMDGFVLHNHNQNVADVIQLNLGTLDATVAEKRLL